MENKNIKRIAHLLTTGLFVIFASIVPVQAGQVVGQVTAIDAASKTIEIDGFKHVLSEAAVKKSNARDADAMLRGFKSGQAVLYEIENSELKRIEALVGGVDFPTRLRPISRTP